MDPETGAAPRFFRVPDDAALPAFDGLGSVARTEGPSREEVETTFFDTPDLALTRAGITLLRSSADGWRLALPAPEGDQTVLRDGSGAGDTVPDGLREALVLHTRGAELPAIGRMRTEAAAFELRGKSDRRVARVRDERVSANALAPADTGTPLAWRQWSAELLDGRPAIVDELSVLLQASGATPAGSGDDVARILGDRMPPPSAPERPRLRKKSSTADVVAAHLRDQLAEFEYWDVLTRWDAPDSVHKLRVALRRLRSALATFRPVLDRTQTDPLRDELKWIAGHLGTARDVEVAREHLAEAVEGEPPELLIGPVPQHLDRELSAEFRAARERALEAMATDRYFALVDRLRAIVADPPWTRRADKPARSALPARVAKDFTRLRKRVTAVEKEADPEARATRLHDVRKAAKRARYAAEALIPLSGKDAERFAEAAERVQEVLGDHHDAVTLLPRLRDLGMQAHLDGENAFSYGRLYSLQEARIADLEAAYRDAWDAASRKKLRRWLR